MNVVILQPSYIPWRGYFHQVLKSDLFIFYDDVQFDKHGWRNRNRIKTANGPQWITIPVISAGALENSIRLNQIPIDWNRKWNEKHWSMISQSYSKTPFFQTTSEWLHEYYQRKPIFLADFTIELTKDIARQMGLAKVEFMRSSELKGITGVKTDRLIQILTSVGATHYISGPSAKAYLEEEKFSKVGISLEYMEYDYPPYPQRYPPFDPHLSILDLMFNTGVEALNFIEPGYLQ
jgi:hypothetical protein